MKTLNEVIKAHDVCHASILDCEGCPYDNGMRYRDSDCYVEDALHYLRAFRDAKDTLEAEKDRYAEAVRNCELAENKYKKMENELNDIRRESIGKMKNDPLTWDELQAMVGKPVWVEILTDEVDISSRWMMVGKETEHHSLPLLWAENVGHWIFAHEENMGRIWQAYRKEQDVHNR